MFNFKQQPSRTGGTIALLLDEDILQQVSFHAGSDNVGETFLRISGAVIAPSLGVERFSMQYHMHGSAVPHLVDEAVDLTPSAQAAVRKINHAA